MSTPVQRQYQDLRKQNPDAVLFFQLGDFYEMFHEDAVLVSRVLGLTLTARHKGTENEMPMAGFPLRASEDYLERMISAGYKVAIADQVEDPVTKIINRKITRIVTPGTSMESGILESEKNSFLAAIVRENHQFGLAYSDLSTGDFRTAFFESEESFLDEITKISPQEILIPGDLFADETFTEKLSIAHLTIRKKINTKHATKMLQDHFKVPDLTVLGLDRLALLIDVSAMVLEYLEETQKTDLTHITKIIRYSTSDIMTLDAQTMRHLEIFQPIMHSEKSSTFLSVFERCYTAMGSRKLRQWIANPLLSKEKIIARQEGVTDLIQNVTIASDLTDMLRPIADLERILSRLVTNRGNARDLAFFRDSFVQFPELQKLCAQVSATAISEKQFLFKGFESLRNELERALVESPPLEITQGGIIQDGYSSELDEYRSLTRDSDQWLIEFLEKKKKESGIQNLKVKYSKNFGFCIEVTKGQKDNVPDTWIRRQTLVNAERLTTPELAEYEERALTAQTKAYELEHKLFYEIRKQICDQTIQIQMAARAIAEIDVLFCFARTAQLWRWVRPEIEENVNELQIAEGRHPVVEKVSSETFISNSLYMKSDSSRIHLITGPNMAGKSTFLRQNALIILLSQIGCYVPAKSAKIGIFDRIFTRVGASDNLAGGQSTYFVEMLETSSILNSATERSFIILDEIGRGTSTFDGISIAWAITEFLHDTVKAKTLFATHYHELIDLAEDLSQAENHHISVAQNNQGIVFLRKILPGGISDSFGIEVAASAGLPHEVIQKARTVLDRLESENLLDKPNLFSVPRVREKIIEVKKESSVEKLLEDIDPEGLSPREALDLVFKIKKLMA